MLPRELQHLHQDGFEPVPDVCQGELLPRKNTESMRISQSRKTRQNHENEIQIKV
jgi:hypothetical protein